MDETGRGFKLGNPIPGHYGGEIRAYESSGMTPAIWVNTHLKTDPNGAELPKPDDVTILLTLDDAEKLRDQLAYLIENHFTRTVYPEIFEVD